MVVSVEHIPGSTMGAIDALSRDLDHDLDKSLFICLQDVPEVRELFNLSDPTITREVSGHLACLKAISTLLPALSHR